MELAKSLPLVYCTRILTFNSSLIGCCSILQEMKKELRLLCKYNARNLTLELDQLLGVFVPFTFSTTAEHY